MKHIVFASLAAIVCMVTTFSHATPNEKLAGRHDSNWLKDAVEHIQIDLRRLAKTPVILQHTIVCEVSQASDGACKGQGDQTEFWSAICNDLGLGEVIGVEPNFADAIGYKIDDQTIVTPYTISCKPYK